MKPLGHRRLQESGKKRQNRSNTARLSAPRVHSASRIGALIQTGQTRLEVSVVIPAINEADCVSRSVGSAFAAGASEVIVVDGGSADATVQVARDAGATLIASDPGRANQQNAGADLATGDTLLFLHADSALDRRCIEQIRRSGTNPAFGAFRQRIDSTDRVYRLIEWGNALRVRYLGMPYGDQGIFIDRALFQQIGGFPAVPIMEDYLVGKRARTIAWPDLLEGPIHTSARRWRQNGVFRQTMQNWSLVLATILGVRPDRLSERYPRNDETSGRPDGQAIAKSTTFSRRPDPS